MDLIFCYTGESCKAVNRSSTVAGDFETVAHISPAGNIRWDRPINTITGDAVLRIEHTADAHRSNFRARMDNRRGLEPQKLLSDMLDTLTSDEESAFWASAPSGYAAKFDALESVYLSRS